MMLKLSFLNVGDGDAALIEDAACGFRVLVDTGRPIPRRCSRMAKTAAEHLKERGIDHLDGVVVTHLHKDHFGGLDNVLKTARVDRVWSGFFPEEGSGRASVKPGDKKTVRGLAECLNLWAQTTEALRAQNCALETVTETMTLRLTERLTAELICPKKEVSAFQRKTWDEMLAGAWVSGDDKYAASKSRNPNSLRLRLHYAGRTVELAGDCYGAEWEDEAQPCDLLKVPHHGDAKALTRKLVQRVKPAWAVISCGAEYNKKKDRPSKDSVELLEQAGARVLFTDAYSLPGRAINAWRAVEFTITDDGELLPREPQRRQEVEV